MTLSVPLLDTSLAISRRFLRGQPIFRPDRSHIHHRLLARGLSQRRAVVALYLAAGVAGALSLALIWAHNHSEAVILITFVCAAIYGIQQLGYAEFGAARKVLFRGGLRQGIRTELVLRALEQSLKDAVTVEDCWGVIQLASKELDLLPVRMHIAGVLFCEGRQGSASSPVLSIAISDGEWIELSLLATAEYPDTLVPFATALRSVLAEKKMQAAYSQEEVTPFASTIYENLRVTVQ